MTPEEIAALIAHHEAGHALACIEYHGPIASVSVSETSGGVMPRTRIVDDEAAIKVSLAGMAGEELLSGRTPVLLASLTDPAVKALVGSHVSNDVARATSRLRLLAPAASEEDVIAVLCGVYREVVAYLADHRAAHSAVAQALLARGRLDGAEVEAIVSAARTGA